MKPLGVYCTQELLVFEDLGKGLALGFTMSPYRSLLGFLRFPGRITESGEPARTHFSHLAGDHRPDCADSWSWLQMLPPW